MGKYQDRRKEVIVEKDQTKSLAWKGIGCVLMIVIPLISFAGASLTVSNETARSILPEVLLGYPVLPQFISRTTYEIQMLVTPITEIEDFYAILLIGLIYMVALGSFISLVYAFLFRAVGPSTVNPLDAPRPNVKTKKYKR